MAYTPVYGVIFDLMGTLARYTGTRSDLHAAWRRGAEALYRYLAGQGLTTPPTTFATTLQAATEAAVAHSGGNPRTVSIPAVLDIVVRQLGFPLATEQALAAERAYFGPELAGWEAMPGAIEAVETLNEEGFRLAVASNAPSHVFVEEAIAHIGLRPFLSPVMSSAKAGARKPDPRLFGAVAAEWQLAPETVVVVGDGLTADIAGAHAAGMRGVLVHSGANQEKARDTGDPIPDANVPEIGAVPALLMRWQAGAVDDRPETGFIEDF